MFELQCSSCTLLVNGQESHTNFCKKNEFKIALNMRRLAWLADIERMRTSEDSKAFDRLSCVISSVLWHHRKKKSLIWTNSSRTINRYHHLWLFDYRLFHFIDNNDFIFRNSRNNLFIFQKSYRIGPESTSTGFSMRSRENIHTISFNRSTWSRVVGRGRNSFTKVQALVSQQAELSRLMRIPCSYKAGTEKLSLEHNSFGARQSHRDRLKLIEFKQYKKKRSSVHVRREHRIDR